MVLRVAICIMALLAAATGCSVKHLVIVSSYSLVEEATASFFAEPDTVLAREAAPGNLKLLEGMAHGAPDHAEILAAAAQLVGAYAFGFLEDCCSDEAEQAASNARAGALYLRGRDYAIRALDASHDFSGMLKLDQAAFEEALDELEQEDVAPLFWATFNWGLYINLFRDDLSALADLSRVLAMAKRTAELDPSYFFGGADMFLMVFNASLGPAVGGSPKEAKLAYDRAWQAGGGRFLLTKYLFAKYYCQQTLDRALFEKLLGEVIAAPDDLLPEQRLTNELAKEKAARLLKRADDLF